MASYEKRSNGMWSCRFRETDENGVVHNKRLPNTYKTKREAQYAYEDYLKSYKERQAAKKAEDEAKQPEPDEMLFDELLESYLSFNKKRVKETSFYDIQSKINNRLRPYFTGKRMKDITPKMISDWIENIEYSYGSKKWILCTLSTIYKYGDKYYDIKNIMNKVDRPRNMDPPKKLEVWSPEEFMLFIKEVNDEVYSAYFKTLYLTGFRRGEASALTWKDVSFVTKEITINKSLSTKTKKGAYVITTPKTKSSYRTIAISDELVETLKKIKRESTDELFVFGGTKPLPSSSIDHRYKRAVEKSGVKNLPIHYLRHAAASYLLHKGVSIVAVSKRLGHKDVKETLNTYAHFMPNDTLSILGALNSMGLN